MFTTRQARALRRKDLRAVHGYARQDHWHEWHRGWQERHGLRWDAASRKQRAYNDAYRAKRQAAWEAKAEAEERRLAAQEEYLQRYQDWCKGYVGGHMSPVGGSRHYNGGLGAFGAWNCPSCGGENSGPLEQGCTACGAGKPGHRAGPPEPPMAPEQDVAEYWATTHPVSSIAEAYRAGYQDGVRAAATARHQPPPSPLFSPAGKTIRTMVAALTLFRDQILVDDPPEVESVEWCSADEATQLIAHLTAQLQQLQAEEKKEPAHA